MSQIILQDVAFIFFCSDIKQQYNYEEHCVEISLTYKDKVSHLIENKANRVIQHDSRGFRLCVLRYTLEYMLEQSRRQSSEKRKPCEIYKAISIKIIFSCPFVLYVIKILVAQNLNCFSGILLSLLLNPVIIKHNWLLSPTCIARYWIVLNVQAYLCLCSFL